MLGPIHDCTHEFQPDSGLVRVQPAEIPGHLLPARRTAAPAHLATTHDAGAAPFHKRTNP